MMIIYCIRLVLELFETNNIESVCVKVHIYCIIIPQVENKIIKKESPKSAHAYVHVLMKPVFYVI